MHTCIVGAMDGRQLLKALMENVGLNPNSLSAATRVAHLTKAAMIAMDRECAASSLELGTYQLNPDSDSFGFVNVIGIFSCAPKP